MCEILYRTINRIAEKLISRSVRIKRIVSCSPDVRVLARQGLVQLLILVWFSQRKRAAVSGVRQEAQEVLGEGERLLDEANQLSDNINKEIEVRKSTQ